MSASTPPITFRRGGDAAAEEADKEGGGPRRGPSYFSLKNDGDEITVRLLTDKSDWAYVAQHSFVPTKPAPEGEESWPRSMMAVCRRDAAFGGFYPDCYIDDAKVNNAFGQLASARTRVWALAVEREIVRGDGSEALGGPTMQNLVVGVRDKTDEVDELDDKGEPTGTKRIFPRILIINQPVKGFFAHFNALYGLHNTLLDRDYTVRREGTGRETDYRITPVDPVPDIRPGTPAWAAYTQALTDREISLDAIIADKASDAYYARWFDPTKTVDENNSVVAVTPAPAPAGVKPDLKAQIRSLGVASRSTDTPPY